MKKQILNLGKALNKVEQKQISGGVSSCDTYSGPSCYGRISGMRCGTCEAYHALPNEHKMCVFVSVDCFPI
jgi:hypothetical protein